MFQGPSSPDTVIFLPSDSILPSLSHLHFPRVFLRPLHFGTYPSLAQDPQDGEQR